MKGWSRSPSPSDARDFACWSSGESVQSIEEEGGDDGNINVDVEGNDDHDVYVEGNDDHDVDVEGNDDHDDDVDGNNDTDEFRQL